MPKDLRFCKKHLEINRGVISSLGYLEGFPFPDCSGGPEMSDGEKTIFRLQQFCAPTFNLIALRGFLNDLDCVFPGGEWRVSICKQEERLEYLAGCSAAPPALFKVIQRLPRIQEDAP